MGNQKRTKRNWLRLFRLLQGKTAEDFANECGLSYATYLNIENGDIKFNHSTRSKTYVLLANTLGINLNLFFYETDEDGRIVDSSCVEDVLRLFYEHNFRSIVRNEGYLRRLFTDVIADRLLEQLRKDF